MQVKSGVVASVIFSALVTGVAVGSLIRGDLITALIFGVLAVPLDCIVAILIILDREPPPA